jgi:hypothetical protein
MPVKVSSWHFTPIEHAPANAHLAVDVLVTADDERHE